MALEFIARNSEAFLLSIVFVALWSLGTFAIIQVRTKWLANKLTLSKSLRDADWEYFKALEDELSRAERNVDGRPGLRTSKASYEKAGLYVTR